VKPLIVPLLLICFCVTLNAQTKAPAQSDPSPSLKETIEWIQEKVKTSGGYKIHVDELMEPKSGSQIRITSDFTGHYTSVSSNNSGCQIWAAFTSVVTASNLPNSVDSDSTLVFDLSRIRPGSTKVGWWKFGPQNTTYSTYTTSPEGYYIITADPLEKDVPVTTSTSRDSALFRFAELNTANRVATALNHAVELCKANAKPEPF
jgi:hypothetical protein